MTLSLSYQRSSAFIGGQIAFFTTLLALSVPCFGQAGRAELFGTIQDPSGRGTPQAKVSLEEQSTGARSDVTTDGRGEYHLLGLAAGRYTLTVQKSGFRPHTQKGVTLRIG